MTDGMNRRGFLKVLGATSGGAVALTACSQDSAEKLIPYLVPPENQIPGMATYYATTCRECPAACGLHVKVREGRAIKLEGNPDHPVNGGKLCARGQAGLQGLYNPDRITGPMKRSASGEFEAVSWEDAVAEVSARLDAESGERIAFLTGNEAGSFDVLVNEWLGAFGSNRHVVHEPFGYEALRSANRQLFGVETLPTYDLGTAGFVISFGADFLETWLSPVAQTRQFSESHSFNDGSMGRYVHVEPRMGQTAIQADEWIAPVPGTEGAVALAMAHVILRDGNANTPRDIGRVRALIESMTPETAAQQSGVPAETIERLAAEFVSTTSVALGGGMGAQHGAADSSAIAVALLNYVAGNMGNTVRFRADVPWAVGSYADLASLESDMGDGGVGVLFVHGADPAYQSEGFAAAMGNVGYKVSFSSYLDDTANLCDLILPDNHPLEQWNSFRPASGGHTLQQPVMQTVFDTRQTGDVLLTLAVAAGHNNTGGLSAENYKEYVRAQWRQVQRRLRDRTPFEEYWNGSLQAGGRWGDTADTRVSLTRTANRISFTPGGTVGDGLTLIAFPSPTFGDGKGANKPWLQEVPDPISKVTWGSWLEMSPARAEEMGVVDGDYVTVNSADGSDWTAAGLPVFVYPGIRDDVVGIATGQGHAQYGRYASGTGTNANHFLSPAPTSFGGRSHYASVTVEFEGGHERLAQNMGRNRQMGRGIAQGTTLAALLEGHQEEHHGEHAAPVPENIEGVIEEWQEAQWDDFRDRGNYAGEHPRWGLAVDLAKCTGCNACVTACYAENNLAVVGKEQVQHGREMSWIRIERYFEGGEHGEPHEISLLPMMCQQCTNAPCEPVCPVFAAYHTPDGLNGQVYNRCVGTRYCANNCPYKVRYFNYFDHQNAADPAFSWPEPLNWQLNPDVTVRAKGVMEKCTFCVQRIRGKQHEARMDDREIQDGEIQTACQQTCPADAIVFGDLKDPQSRVSQMAADERAYHVLGGLNTKPGVTYLKQVRNRAEA